MLTYFRALARPEQLPTERWLPVVGWEGIYEVSDHGNVRSLDRQNAAGRRTKGQPMKTFNDGTDHLQLVLAGRGKPARRFVHRLVLEAFVGPCPEGQEGCHGDGNGLNNHLSNLRWDTRSANKLDEVRHGVHPFARRTHCPRNHPLVAPNLVRAQVARGHRSCLACARAHNYAHAHGEQLDPARADQYFRALWPAERQSAGSAIGALA